jgi:hypothetical protein
MRRAGVLAIHYFVEIFGILDICRFHVCDVLLRVKISNHTVKPDISS